MSMLLLSSGAFARGGAPEKVVTFRFVPGEDMFYIPWEGNAEQLTALYSLIDRYRNEIAEGAIPVYVRGYSASMKSLKRNMELAFVRSNRVKSELITNKGLVEDNFITKNHAEPYVGTDGQRYKDLVVVTLRIPVKDEPRPSESSQEEPVAVIEEKSTPAPTSEPKPEPRPVAEPEPAAPFKSYCFAVRTNLLYDAFLLPTLGIEWRISPSVGVKIDGSRSWWGSGHGKVQKIWLLNPEVRWYMGAQKRFYAGVSGNYGEYNIYKYVVGGLFSSNTGYQGQLWSAGLTVGYQLRLSQCFSLDFNLGLGYTRFEYDSFRMAEDIRVYKERDKTKNFWGPTQVGVNLIWTIGSR